jgi:hypothetical protein
MLMAANYGVRAVAHAQAVTLAPQLFGQRFGERCDPGTATIERTLVAWPRTTEPSGSIPDRTCLVEIAAMPTFMSPFRWRVIAQLSNGYELHDIDVLDPTPGHSPGEAFWRRTVRYPNQWTPPTFVAATAPVAAVFLGFSRFPAARTFSDRSGTTTVRWTDMRFVAGPASADGPRPPNLFNVLVQIDSSGRIVREQIGK